MGYKIRPEDHRLVSRGLPTLANSADPDKMPRNVAFNQGFQCLLTECFIKKNEPDDKYHERPLQCEISMLSNMQFYNKITICF